MRRRVANKVVNKSSVNPKNHNYKLGTVFKAGRTADIKVVRRANRRMMMRMLMNIANDVIEKSQASNHELAS